jgi:hypothetical protein
MRITRKQKPTAADTLAQLDSLTASLLASTTQQLSTATR